jgi:hypothetical protein
MASRLLRPQKTYEKEYGRHALPVLLTRKLTVAESSREPLQFHFGVTAPAELVQHPASPSSLVAA